MAVQILGAQTQHMVGVQQSFVNIFLVTWDNYIRGIICFSGGSGALTHVWQLRMVALWCWHFVIFPHSHYITITRMCTVLSTVAWIIWEYAYVWYNDTEKKNDKFISSWIINCVFCWLNCRSTWRVPIIYVPPGYWWPTSGTGKPVILET